MEILTYICWTEYGKYKDFFLVEGLEFFAHIIEGQKLLL